MNDAYRLHPRLVPEYACVAARRRLWLEMRRVGVTDVQIEEWSQSTWWPSLREESVFTHVRSFLDVRLVRPGGQWADTQILIRLPDEDGVEQGPPHLDDLPAWAVQKGLRYRAIYAVELTGARHQGGGTMLYPHGVERPPVCPPLHTGDVLEMGPQLLHSGTPNHRGDVRMALFFRLLEPAR